MWQWLPSKHGIALLGVERRGGRLNGGILVVG